MALLTLGIVALAFVLAARRFPGIDFYQFWTVGQAAREFRGTDVYSSAAREELGRVYAGRSTQGLRAGTPPAEIPERALAAAQRVTLETYSTPWLYTVFGLGSSGDYSRDRARFEWLSCAALVGGMLALARGLGASWGSAALAALLAVAAFAPSDSCARVGNVNRLQLGLLALILFAQRGGTRAGDFAAGVLWGLGVGFKPNLSFAALALALGLLAARQFARLWSTLAGGIVGAALCASIAWAWFGSLEPWRSWMGVMGELMREYDSPIEKGNLSLLRALEAAGWSPAPRAVLLLAWALWVAALVAGRARLAAALAGGGSARARAQTLLAATGLAISVLTVELAWLHYFVLLLPLALVLLLSCRGAEFALAALATAGISLYAPRALFGFADNAPQAAWSCAGSALVLFLLALAQLARGAFDHSPRA